MTTTPSQSIDSARGQRIRALREQHGWSRRELASRAGVGLRSVEYYEAGRPLRSKAVALLAAALGVTDHFLLTGEQTIEQRIDAQGERLERVEARLAEMEFQLARATQASRRIWVSVDATLRLVLTHLASEDELTKLPEPLSMDDLSGNSHNADDLQPERVSPSVAARP